LVAELLVSELGPYLAHRTTVTYDSRPELLGDLPPLRDEVNRYIAELPFLDRTNRQGIRRVGDVTFPRTGTTRLLCIGDSFTYGAYVHDHDAYPNQLESLLPDAEVFNAGISGYALCDELSYFEQRGRFVEADIVILQVHANDVYGLHPHMRVHFCRGGEHCDGFRGNR
jgi:hypothetical protein